MPFMSIICAVEWGTLTAIGLPCAVFAACLIVGGWSGLMGEMG